MGCAQALLEMQRQRESTRLGNTRELPRRSSSSAATTLPAASELDGSTTALTNGHMRRQSLSFTGAVLLFHRWLALPRNGSVAFCKICLDSLQLRATKK